MLLLWLATFALATFPQLHHWLHSDSQSPAHNCVVTQVQQHSIHAACAPTISAQAPIDYILVVKHQPVVIPAAFDYRLSPSRAPPLA
jgi:hypothetical protein